MDAISTGSSESPFSFAKRIASSICQETSSEATVLARIALVFPPAAWAASAWGEGWLWFMIFLELQQRLIFARLLPRSPPGMPRGLSCFRPMTPTPPQCPLLQRAGHVINTTKALWRITKEAS